MIGKLRGLVDAVDDDTVILDVGGVGYLVAASAKTLRALPPKGQAIELLIETQVREDAIRLYGFMLAAERDWFRLLQTVQGVGSKVALAILGVLRPSDLAVAVSRQDKAMVARAQGVGPKLAARIVAELKDKTPAPSEADVPGLGPGPTSSDGLPRAGEDAVLALINLGYGRPQALGAVIKGLGALGADAAASALIRAGLKELAQ